MNALLDTDEMRDVPEVESAPVDLKKEWLNISPRLPALHLDWRNSPCRRVNRF